MKENYPNSLSEDALRNNMLYDYEVSPSSYISKGWEIFKQNMGLFLGYQLLQIPISVATAFIPGSSLLVSMPLNAGFHIGAYKTDKGEELNFGDFFKGFNHFAPLLILTFFMVLIVFAAIIPFGIVIGIGAASGAEKIVFILGGLGILAASAYFAVSYMFSNLFIIFGDRKAWDAMELSRKFTGQQFWGWLGFILLLALLNLGGLLCLGIGVFFTMCISNCAIYAAFNDIFHLTEEGTDSDDNIIQHLV